MATDEADRGRADIGFEGQAGARPCLERGSASIQQADFRRDRRDEIVIEVGVVVLDDRHRRVRVRVRTRRRSCAADKERLRAVRAVVHDGDDAAATAGRERPEGDAERACSTGRNGAAGVVGHGKFTFAQYARHDYRAAADVADIHRAGQRSSRPRGVFGIESALTKESWPLPGGGSMVTPVPLNEMIKRSIRVRHRDRTAVCRLRARCVRDGERT